MAFVLDTAGAIARTADQRCVVGSFLHALVNADDSLVAARSLSGARADADRWIHAANLDLDRAAALDDLAPAAAPALEDARAATRLIASAPDFCFDHAIDAARRSLAGAATASGSTLDQARAGAAACADGHTWKTAGALAADATASRTFAANADHRYDPDVMDAWMSAKRPDGELRPKELAAARAARDELAATFDPLVHDLITHARSLRDVPLERIDAGKYPIVTVPASSPGPTNLESTIPRPASGMVARVEHIAVAQPSASRPDGSQLDLPVGEYGMPLARAQLRAGAALQRVIEERMRADAGRVAHARPSLVSKWTFQEMAVLTSLKEGITSIAQTAAVATQRRLPGMDEAQLLERLGDSHVFDRIAKGPMGFIAPIARSGRQFEQPLAVDAAGAVRVGPDFDQLLRDTLEHRRTTAPPARSTRAGCPIALRNRSVTLEDGTIVRYERTLLSELAREYLLLTQRFLRHEQAAGIPPAVMI